MILLLAIVRPFRRVVPAGPAGTARVRKPWYRGSGKHARKPASGARKPSTLQSSSTPRDWQQDFQRNRPDRTPARCVALAAGRSRGQHRAGNCPLPPRPAVVFWVHSGRVGAGDRWRGGGRLLHFRVSRPGGIRKKTATRGAHPAHCGSRVPLFGGGPVGKLLARSPSAWISW